ncbi:MAG: hypothetical protein KDK53_04040 [Maritimibacter sp.]|nr:hypothetical protein [Maritimibacter sp.]
MTKFISTFGKSARLAAMAAVVGVLVSSAAVAATCAQVPGIKTAITNSNNVYHCNTNNNKDPECALLTTLDQCCVDPSATVAEACLCNTSNLLNPGYDLTAAGLDVNALCPQ